MIRPIVNLDWTCSLSYLSLEKYLYGNGKSPGVSPVLQAQANGYYDLACDLLVSISRTMVSGEPLSDIGRELDRLRESLKPNEDRETLRALAQSFQELLQSFKARLQKADQERADDFRKILSILNEAFASLDSGGERSGVRMKQLERSLQDASKMEDLRSLKVHLSNVLQFVRQESEDESQKTRSALEALGAQLEVAHQAAVKYAGGKLASREHGLAYLAGEIDQENENVLYAGLFVADALRAVRLRHGNQVSEGLLCDISRKLLGKVVPDAQAFEWSSDALLVVWRSKENFTSVSEHVRNALNVPLENRAFVGTRVANFSLSVRSLLVEARGKLDQIVSNLDQFMSGALT